MACMYLGGRWLSSVGKVEGKKGRREVTEAKKKQQKQRMISNFCYLITRIQQN